MFFLPFKPIKGQAFTLDIRPISQETNLVLYVSKDGGTPTQTTNTGVLTGTLGTETIRYNHSIELTVDEMNANRVTVYFVIGGHANTDAYTIYTQTAELAAVPTTASSLSDKITALWQYFFLKRDMTNTTINMYKDDATTALCSSTVTDDGTTVAKGEFS